MLWREGIDAFCWGIDAFDLGDRASRARGSTFGAGGFIVWSEGIDVRARGAFDWGHATGLVCHRPVIALSAQRELESERLRLLEVAVDDHEHLERARPLEVVQSNGFRVASQIHVARRETVGEELGAIGGRVEHEVGVARGGDVDQPLEEPAKWRESISLFKDAIVSLDGLPNVLL